VFKKLLVVLAYVLILGIMFYAVFFRFLKGCHKFM
jgi:hypothetical protein